MELAELRHQQVLLSEESIGAAKNAVVANRWNGKINCSQHPFETGVLSMKSVVRISLVALLKAGFSAPASAAPAAAPPRHYDTAGAFLRPRPDWCIFPPSPWCDRKMNRWYS